MDRLLALTGRQKLRRSPRNHPSSTDPNLRMYAEAGLEELSDEPDEPEADGPPRTRTARETPARTPSQEKPSRGNAPDETSGTSVSPTRIPGESSPSSRSCLSETMQDTTAPPDEAWPPQPLFPQTALPASSRLQELQSLPESLATVMCPYAMRRPEDLAGVRHIPTLPSFPSAPVFELSKDIPRGTEDWLRGHIEEIQARRLHRQRIEFERQKPRLKMQEAAHKTYMDRNPFASLVAQPDGAARRNRRAPPTQRRAPATAPEGVAAVEALACGAASDDAQARPLCAYCHTFFAQKIRRVHLHDPAVSYSLCRHCDRSRLRGRILREYSLTPQWYGPSKAPPPEKGSKEKPSGTYGLVYDSEDDSEDELQAIVTIAKRMPTERARRPCNAQNQRPSRLGTRPGPRPCSQPLDSIFDAQPRADSRCMQQSPRLVAGSPEDRLKLKQHADQIGRRHQPIQDPVRSRTWKAQPPAQKLQDFRTNYLKPVVSRHSRVSKTAATRPKSQGSSNLGWAERLYRLQVQVSQSAAKGKERCPWQGTSVVGDKTGTFAPHGFLASSEPTNAVTEAATGTANAARAASPASPPRASYDPSAFVASGDPGPSVPRDNFDWAAWMEEADESDSAQQQAAVVPDEFPEEYAVAFLSGDEMDMLKIDRKGKTPMYKIIDAQKRAYEAAARQKMPARENDGPEPMEDVDWAKQTITAPPDASEVQQKKRMLQAQQEFEDLHGGDDQPPPQKRLHLQKQTETDGCADYVPNDPSKFFGFF